MRSQRVSSSLGHDSGAACFRDRLLGGTSATTHHIPPEQSASVRRRIPRGGFNAVRMLSSLAKSIDKKYRKKVAAGVIDVKLAVLDLRQWAVL
jgi:hypothetical protein